MEYRYQPYYKPQRQHPLKLGLGRGREENRGSGEPGKVDHRGRARQKNERGEVRPHFFSSSPTFMKKPSLFPSFEVDEIKLRAARRRLFETGPGHQDQDWNKGFKNELKMKMNGKTRQLRDSLPKRKKAPRNLNPPIPFFFDDEEELKTKGGDFHHQKKFPKSFKPTLFSTPSKGRQPRYPWTLECPPPLIKPQPEVFKVPGHKVSLPQEADWSPSLDVRQWRDKVQPGAPLDFRAQKKMARAGERREKKVPQPRTPPKNLLLVPELAVTQDKMARVRQWRDKNQQDLPRPDRHRQRQELDLKQRPKLDLRQRPELELTQDKMVRVKEWRENIQLEIERDAREGERSKRDQKRNQNMPVFVSTLHKLNAVDWLNDDNQHLQSLYPWDVTEDHRKPRDQRKKADQDWGNYLEFGNGCQFDDENDETYDFRKIFE